MKFVHVTKRAMYVWDTKHPYSANSERITVHSFDTRLQDWVLIDAWGCELNSESDFHAAIRRREELQGGPY